MRKRALEGFTLIELMITVAIVAILASVAYPAFTQHFVRAKRSAAQSFMVTVANRQEQQMLNTRCYFNYPTDPGCTPPAITVPSEVAANYTITVMADNASTPPSYTVTAAPIAGSPQRAKDGACASLTYNQAGVKGITGTGTVANCWK